MFKGHSTSEAALDRRERLLNAAKVKKVSHTESVCADPLAASLGRMVKQQFPSRNYQYSWLN